LLDWLRAAFRFLGGASTPLALPQQIDIEALGPYDTQYKWDNGEKFPGGMGPIDILLTDYWGMRKRSAELFERNGYFRGIVRRLITNEIGIGLHLECTPDEHILDEPTEALAAWSEDVEIRFQQWSDDPWLCDISEQNTFGALQEIVRQEAMVEGDVLVQLVQFQGTKLPRLKVVSGSRVQTPWGEPAGVASGNKIVDGVEIDGNRRHIAYWVTQDDGTTKRVPAFGPKTGRRLAWLVYGGDKRLDQIRGKPLLSIVIQSLKEIDRYRDSTQRKALLNSLLAMVVEKTNDRPGTQPLAGGAVRKGVELNRDGVESRPRSFKFSEFLPGLVIDELQVGETIKAHPTNGTDERFGLFEEAIVAGVSWWFEIPPEILTLSFNSNYSASQAAINEFKIYLRKATEKFGATFCQPVFVEWLVSMALTGKIAAAKLLESWRDSSKYDLFAAWTAHEWLGNIKPAVDASKLVDGYAVQIREGLMTRARATREINGGKFSKVVAQLKLENEQVAEANKPLLAINEKVQVAKVQQTGEDSDDVGEDGSHPEDRKDGDPSKPARLRRAS
jgi:lambda family phage portal protein